MFDNIIESTETPVEGYLKIVNSLPAVRGTATGKSTQRILPEGINLDIFTAVKDNWGFIFAIRTGSAEYSHRILANGWVKAGYKGVDGMLTVYNKPVPVYEEEDLFKLIGIPWIKPELRNL
jgi:DNA polymerase/3'-5' exonuclease PolX